jgi:hypothetical protein
MLLALTVSLLRIRSFRISSRASLELERPFSRFRVNLCRSRRGRNRERLSVFARMSLGVSPGESADRSHTTVTECA